MTTNPTYECTYGCDCARPPHPSGQDQQQPSKDNNPSAHHTNPDNTTDGARRQSSEGLIEWVTLIEAYRRDLLRTKSKEAIVSRINYLKRLAGRLDSSPASTSRRDLILTIASFPGSPVSRNNLIGIVRNFFSWARETNRIASNPALGLPTVTTVHNFDVVAALPRLRGEVMHTEPRDRLIILLAACAGLRSAEISRLHTDDINAAENTITVAAPDSRRRRVVPAHPSLIKEILKHGPGWVFLSRDHPGEHVPLGTVQRAMRRVLPPELSIEKLRFMYAHDLYSEHPILSDALLAKEAIAS
ncbi:tyrosine-type recombinase/integrase [Brevibacterium picturae]|uniref:Integrase n=1 Tax=Brevibacterium picturae TaxID=260553 RepID=A0ABN2C2V0_9MICO